MKAISKLRHPSSPFHNLAITRVIVAQEGSTARSCEVWVCDMDSEGVQRGGAERGMLILHLYTLLLRTPLQTLRECKRLRTAGSCRVKSRCCPSLHRCPASGMLQSVRLKRHCTTTTTCLSCVFPSPGGPHTSVIFPRGNPPPNISSSLAQKVTMEPRDSSSCRSVKTDCPA